MDTPKEQLDQVREWAQWKLDTQLARSWYPYMKLIEAIDGIRAGMGLNAAESLTQSEASSARRLRVVASARRPESAQPVNPGEDGGMPEQCFDDAT